MLIKGGSSFRPTAGGTSRGEDEDCGGGEFGEYLSVPQCAFSSSSCSLPRSELTCCWRAGIALRRSEAWFVLSLLALSAPRWKLIDVDVPQVY